jgi:hypothetical protein
VADDLELLLSGRRPLNVVNAEVLDRPKTNRAKDQ